MLREVMKKNSISVDNLWEHCRSVSKKQIKKAQNPKDMKSLDVEVLDRILVGLNQLVNPPPKVGDVFPTREDAIRGYRWVKNGKMVV